MDVTQLVASMTPEIYHRLRQAVETGKWLDGSELSETQRETSMQAVLMYQSQVLGSDEHMTVGRDGDIVHKSRQQLKQQFNPDASDTDAHTIARFTQDDI